MAANAFLARLKVPRAVLLDGAMGTELIERGLDPARARAPQWSLERPEEVLAVHRAYVAAGAELVLTNTFFDPTAAECEASVRLARASNAALVGGSLHARAKDLAGCVRALSGADVIWIETATSLDDAHRALAVAQKETALPVVVTLAAFVTAPFPGPLRGYNCGPWGATPRAQVLKLDGTSRAPAEWAALLARSGARLVGGCCGTTPAHIAALADVLR